MVPALAAVSTTGLGKVRAVCSVFNKTFASRGQETRTEVTVLRFSAFPNWDPPGLGQLIPNLRNGSLILFTRVWPWSWHSQVETRLAGLCSIRHGSGSNLLNPEEVMWQNLMRMPPIMWGDKKPFEAGDREEWNPTDFRISPPLKMTGIFPVWTLNHRTTLK